MICISRSPGSIVASEAIFESQPTENQFFGTTAEYNESDKVWTLNGEKSFVINAQDANLFLVVAQVNTLNRSGNMEDGVAVFLVDSTLPGVKVEAKKSFGIQGARQGTVQLRKVTVPEGKPPAVQREDTLISHVFLFRKYARRSERIWNGNPIFTKAESTEIRTSVYWNAEEHNQRYDPSCHVYKTEWNLFKVGISS